MAPLPSRIRFPPVRDITLPVGNTPGPSTTSNVTVGDWLTQSPFSSLTVTIKWVSAVPSFGIVSWETVSSRWSASPSLENSAGTPVYFAGTNTMP